MKTIETKVYEYDELSDTAKEKAENRAGKRGKVTTIEKEKIEAWLFERCDFSGYENALGTLDLTTREGKAVALHSVFMSEVGKWRIPQRGKMTALIDWLCGLPSVLNVPFEYCDIIEQSKALGRIPKTATDSQEERACESWFPWVAMRLLGLWGSVGLR